MTSPEDLVGKVLLGHYRIVRPLARGGMGVIYLARNEGAAGFVRPVVVKRIVPDFGADQSFVRMFVREAKILAQLRHPGIVGILDFAEERGTYLMVLEYVHGYSLHVWSKYLRRTGRPFAIGSAIEIVLATLDALHYAHRLQSPDGEPLHIVHRDVSPGNVLIDVEGHVKLADFGIARTQVDRTEASSMTELKGKLAYMAPEIFQQQDPSAASDLFSCGVILHELLAGKNEFQRPDAASTAASVLTQELTPLHQIRTDVPESLSRVVARAVARIPERFETAQDFARALREATASLPASETLAEAAARDFWSPGFSGSPGVTDLDDLDRSWREDGPASPAGPPPSASVQATQVTLPPRQPRSRRGWTAALAAAAAIGLGAVGVGLAWRSPDRPATQFVLIDGDARPVRTSEEPVEPPSRPADERTGAAAAPDAGARAPSAPSAPSGSPAAGTHEAPRAAPAGRGEDLGRAFSTRRGLVARCVEQHATDVRGAPEVVIRFRVGTDGRAEAVHLEPGSIESTPIGACILGVARATSFPPQERPVSFRIPVSFRRR